MKIGYEIPFNKFEEICREIDETEENVEIGVYQVSKDSRRLKDLPKERIFSFHGPTLPLSLDFLPQIKRAANIGLYLGVDFMILHPHKAKWKIDEKDDEKENKRKAEQEKAFKCLEAITRETETKVVLETFKGGNRVFTPDEILKYKIPMDLDTSHLDSLYIYNILFNSLDGVYTVHISERRDDENHQPIGKFGEDIVYQLIKKKWKGILCFEYMPKFLDQARKDTKYMRLVTEGFDALETKEQDKATEKFSKAIEIKAEGYLGHYGLGFTFLRRGLKEEASKELARVKELHSGQELFLH